MDFTLVQPRGALVGLTTGLDGERKLVPVGFGGVCAPEQEGDGDEGGAACDWEHEGEAFGGAV